MNQASAAYNFKLQCERSKLILDKYLNIIEPKKENYEEVIEAKYPVCDISTNFECENESKFDVATLSEHSDNENLDKNKNKCSVKKGSTINRKTKCKRKRNQVNEMDKLHFCSTCNKSFTNKYVFHAHRKRHEFKGQFLCNVCGKGFNSQSCLTRHSRVHTGERKYECSVCHKKFPSSNNLNLHSRIHSGHKPYLCTVCGKSFSHPTGLTYHMRTHTKEKPYSCDVCGKQFAIQCHVTRHKKTHSGWLYRNICYNNVFTSKLNFQVRDRFLVHNVIKLLLKKSI